ncbi:aminodeoxychorismate lyase [uncultured Shewanella sp.]|uniref:aminodeoxychorismate lyase n=1 Tax=Shewanella atlantica TaxID=271099 RepID=UPI0026226703|nr:aminodeoxychorismate lyase [uncultured Shewanella sp.]
MNQVWVDGELASQVSPLDRGLAYGDGLFATMRFSGGELQFLTAHLQRLTQGARRLGLDWCAGDALITLIKQLATTHVDGCLKLILTRGVGGRGYTAPEQASVTEVLSLSTIPGHYGRWQTEGISLKTSEVMLAGQPLLAGIKHLNRLEQVLIKSKQLPVGFDDWLVMDRKHTVIESSMANLFLVGEHCVFTPDISMAGVAGMMREQVIYALIELGFDLHVGEVTYSQLSRCRHAFITNSLFGIVDINRIDEIKFERAPFTDSIRHSLNLNL